MRIQIVALTINSILGSGKAPGNVSVHASENDSKTDLTPQQVLKTIMIMT